VSERFKPAMVACERCQAVYFKRRPWARFCSKACKDLHEKETAVANARDAERYRFVRTHQYNGQIDMGELCHPASPQALHFDRLVDAAMEAE
jgi:hypothetical protein